MLVMKFGSYQTVDMHSIVRALTSGFYARMLAHYVKGTPYSAKERQELMIAFFLDSVLNQQS
jgi:hypothetical protein